MSMLDVKIIRLSTGEELIGELKDEGDSWKVLNVCQIAASYADPTQATARIGLAPFMPYSKIKDGFVICLGLVLRGMCDQIRISKNLTVEKRDIFLKLRDFSQ